MARKFLYFVAILVGLVIAALLILRIWSTELTQFAFVPRGAFQPLPALPADAYQNPAMWISRPGLADDPSRYLPEGARAGVPGKAWVFFVHPSSYMARDHWNGAVDDQDAQARAALFIQGMASAFNGEQAIWAPRYRQAAFGSFLVDRPESHRALEIAYADVAQAFDAFVKAAPPDVPIVLAGHSQGSLHLLRLVKEHVKGTPVEKRIVAIYAVGWPISARHDLPAMGVPACTSPDQAGCVMSWLSFGEPADPALMLNAYRTSLGLDGKPHGSEPVVCTNPLNGGAAPDAPAQANLGTMVPAPDLKSGKIVPQSVPARCDPKTGLLMLGDGPDVGPYVLPGKNYHVYDIPLFWTNVRADVARREAAWTAAQGK